MTNLAPYTRSMLGYNQWANERILGAAAGLSDHEYESIAGALSHVLGTQRWWHAAWTGGALPAPADLPDLEAARAAYARSHEDLRAFAGGLEDSGLLRAEAWWKQWGYHGAMSIADVIAQLFFHGTQHRAEIALKLTSYRHSPGDLDYLFFKNPDLPAEAVASVAAV